MRLLDGGLSRTFAKAFSSIYLSATLHKRRVITDDEGSATEVVTNYPCRAQVDSATEAMRASAGFADTDRRILVLTDTLAIEPDTDCEITVRGQRFGIASVVADPAFSHWDMRGTRV